MPWGVSRWNLQTDPNLIFCMIEQKTSLPPSLLLNTLMKRADTYQHFSVLLKVDFLGEGLMNER